MRRALWAAMLYAVPCLGACGDDDVEGGSGDAATAPSDAGSAPSADAAQFEPLDAAEPAIVPDAAPAPDAAAPQDAATNDSGNGFRPAPTNVSFETAQRVEPDQKVPLQDVRKFDQVDYYVFRGEQGEFFEISTDRATFSPDVVVTLYDAARTPLAYNDDGGLWPGDPFDARLVVRLPLSGDYFIKVEDPYTPPQFFTSSLPLLYYHLRVRQLTDGVDGVAIAHGDVRSTVTFAHDDKTGYGYATVLGEFGEATGVFDLQGQPAQALIGHVLASGADGNGSTALGGVLRVLDPEQRVLASIDRQKGQSAIDPPLGEAGYQLKVFAGGPLGENPFYAIDLVMLGDNPSEQNEAENGVLEAAEAIDMRGTTSRRGLLLVHLPEHDVDYFKLDVSAQEVVTVACEGASGGSGVQGLVAELRDGSDQVLAEAGETASTTLQLNRFTVTATGTYYVRLASDTPSADSTSTDPWARCAVLVGF